MKSTIWNSQDEFKNEPKLYKSSPLALENKLKIRMLSKVDVKKFWKREFLEYMKYDLLPVMNKTGGMLVHPAIRRVLIENTEEVSLRKPMD